MAVGGAAGRRGGGAAAYSVAPNAAASSPLSEPSSVSRSKNSLAAWLGLGVRVRVTVRGRLRVWARVRVRVRVGVLRSRLLDAGNARGSAHHLDAVHLRLGEVGLGEHLS
jgi:hypothetical protein